MTHYYQLLIVLFTIALPFIHLPTLQGQSATASGSVYFEDGEIGEGAFVRLMTADTARMIDYVETDVQGEWEIALPKERPLVLQVTFFGYQTAFRTITEPGSVSSLEFQLQKQSFDLDAVTVEEKAFGVRREGDTLTFRLETYTTGAERTLGDVLNRLPGMEIRDGSVYYGGEKITKMLVQGRDIINANQQLATEGIRADQLKEIKVIENYKAPSEQFQTERSDDVAMDVRLKEGELSKWSGEAELMAGYPSSVKADVSGFNLGDKVGLSGFVRANNVGERVLTFQDMMSMLSQESGRRFRGGRGQLFSLIPGELGISDQVQANLDGIVNINADIDVTKTMKLKGFVMGAFAKRETEVFSIIDYVAEDQTRTEQMVRETQTPLGSTFWKIEWNVDSTSFLEAGIPFSLNTTEADETRIGTFGTQSFDTRNNEDRWSYNLAPFAKYRKRIGEDNVWRVDSRMEVSRQDGTQLYEDIFPFLGLTPAPNDSLFRITQNQVLETTDFKISSSYKMKSGDWFAEPSLEYNYMDQAVNHTAPEKGALDFAQRDEMLQHTGIASLVGGYESKDWEVVPSFTLNYFDRSFLLEGDQEEVFPGYGLRMVRKFNRAHTLTIDGNYGLSYPDFSNIWGVNQINSSTQVSTGSYPIDLARKGYSVSARYHNFMVTRRTFIFARASYNYNEDVISNFTENIGAFILSGYLPTPSSQSFSFNNFMGYNLGFLPIRLEPSIFVNWSEGFSTNGKEEFPTERLNQSYSFEIESRWDYPLNVELGISYNNNRVSRNTQAPISFESWQPSVELDYKIGKFKFQSSFALDRATGQNQSSDLYLLDFDVFYDFDKLPLSFKLQANNILNLDPRERVRSSFNINISQVQRYQIFPGYIIAGATWQF
jgi:hypothetical protein